MSLDCSLTPLPLGWPEAFSPWWGPEGRGASLGLNLTYLRRLAGIEGLEKKMETTIMGLYKFRVQLLRFGVQGLGFGRNGKENGN